MEKVKVVLKRWMEKIKEALELVIFGFLFVLLHIVGAITVVVACGFYVWDKARGK